MGRRLKRWTCHSRPYWHASACAWSFAPRASQGCSDFSLRHWQPTTRGRQCWQGIHSPHAKVSRVHTLVRLVLRHLFGVRFYQNCPQCAKSASPCTDAFGSNAMACGGILGRVDAAYGAVEFQKAGSAHVHFQLFVQCVHQHTPLSHMAKRHESVLQELLRRAGKYNAHVRRTVYCDPAEWDERRREVVEQAWPEYRDELLMGRGLCPSFNVRREEVHQACEHAGPSQGSNSPKSEKEGFGVEKPPFPTNLAKGNLSQSKIQRVK